MSLSPASGVVVHTTARFSAVDPRLCLIPVGMAYQAGHAEVEEGLDKYFDKAKFTVGGDTAQLQDACEAIQQFIAQELWCVAVKPKNKANCCCVASSVVMCVCYTCDACVLRLPCNCVMVLRTQWWRFLQCYTRARRVTTAPL